MLHRHLQENDMPSQDVRVNVRRSGTKVELSVDPWLAELKQGDTIEWQLAKDADTEELEITARLNNDWPFEDAPPRASKGKPARAGSMRPHAYRELPYRYNVEFTCGGHRIVVDPEMIIRGP
jgi:hypothetical protein